MTSGDFFRDITLRVCSSLDIRVSLDRCFALLSQHLPVDTLFLDIHDPKLGAIRRIAQSSGAGPVNRDEIIPLPEEIWQQVVTQKTPEIFDSAHETAHTKKMADLVQRTDHCDLVIPLSIEEQPIGVLVLRANGSDRYNPHHAELMQSVAEPFAIALANALAHQELLHYRDILLDDNSFYRHELAADMGDTLIGADAGLHNVMEAVHQVAPLNNTVLLVGETGVGKEVIANAIHQNSPRRNAPFIKVNCGAIAEGLIDSELFGHEKGAFTGAIAAKRGRFERADGGTLFLDEIGELPPAAQTRLLRVLQTRELERVGGSRTIPVNIRVIAATHRNLEQMIAENRFREDLWFRINAFPIFIPPLRQRREDIASLARHFVITRSRDMGVTLPTIIPGALERLKNYSWPGNVRELQNIVEREIIRCREGKLTFDSLPGQQEALISSKSEDTQLPNPVNLDAAMARHIELVLKITNGKISGAGGAAELMGINATTLRSRMSKLGIGKTKRVGDK